MGAFGIHSPLLREAQQVEAAKLDAPIEANLKSKRFRDSM